MQTERIVPHRVFGVVFTPSVVRELTKHLEDAVVALRFTVVGQLSSDRLGLAGANVCSLEDSADYALCRYWIFLNIVCIAVEQATEIL